MIGIGMPISQSRMERMIFFPHLARSNGNNEGKPERFRYEPSARAAVAGSASSSLRPRMAARNITAAA